MIDRCGRDRERDTESTALLSPRSFLCEGDGGALAKRTEACAAQQDVELGLSLIYFSVGKAARNVFSNVAWSMQMLSSYNDAMSCTVAKEFRSLPPGRDRLSL